MTPDTDILIAGGGLNGPALALALAQAGLPVTDRLVAMVGVYSVGFEGADHRFIAVPFVISD